MNASTVLITGAGGFIGGHLTQDLLAQGLSVRAVDVKALSDWHLVCEGAENIVADVSL